MIALHCCALTAPLEMAEVQVSRMASEESAGSDRLTSAVAEGCPAFTDGCPYAKNQSVVEWINSTRGAGSNGACPAFKDGCPFHDVQNLDSLRKELEKLPSSHAVAGDSPSNRESQAAHAVLLGMLQAVHKASVSMKETVGAECPVFQQACPFKNCVTSKGTPLVMELEIRTWGLGLEDTEAPEASKGSTESPSQDPEPEDEEAGLANKLKEGTKEAHVAAESVHFMKEFIRGRVTRELYGQLVVNLYYVYKALEEGLRQHAEHPLIEPLFFPEELERETVLEQDCEFYCGPDWKERVKPTPVGLEYVARLEEIARDAPELLVPHAYTRYLGDLSGGQVLRRCAIKGMKLPDDGSGVRFFVFNRIRDMKVFKNMYRARMDGLPADKQTADRMVVEANHAFNLNTRVFQELDVLAGFVAEDEVLLAPPAPPASKSAEALAAVCPFAALAAAGVAMPMDHPPVSKAAKGPAKEKELPPAPKEVSVSAPKGSLVSSRHAAIAASLALLLAFLISWLSSFVA